ncbi:MAG: ATP-binding protein, partial [Chitinophagaceae bacterium]
MLIEFSISNFRSFKELTVLSMEAAKIRSKYQDLDVDNVFEARSGVRLLKSKAIYGANASGKSNLAKAFSCFKQMVRLSTNSDKPLKQAADDFVLKEPQKENEPVFYQIRFIFELVEYRYGFTASQNAVDSEWLFARSGSHESKLFVREGEKVSVNVQKMGEAKAYEHSFKAKTSELFQPWTLFLSATAIIGVELAKVVRDAIGTIDILSDNYREYLHLHTLNWWSNRLNMQNGIALLKSADVDIDEVGITEQDPDWEVIPKEVKEIFQADFKGQKIPHFTSIRTIKDSESKLRVETLFDSFESEGTKKLLYLIPIILAALNDGNVLLIDEFDAQLHPRLSQKIVDLFNSSETNPHNAQLIFITHDVGLLKPYKLRRDQIAFVAKDKRGCSTLSTLVEYKGVR